MIDLFPGALSRPVTAGEAFINVSKSGIDKEFLVLEGKTSKLIKQLKPGQRLEQLYEQIHGKGNKAYFAFSRTHPNRPARTIAKDSAGLFHYCENRTLTIGEYKRIASFPDRFNFIRSFSAALYRLGNSVPPLLMRSIAAQIRHKLWQGDPLTRYPKTMTYPEILEASWQDHLAPRPPNAPTVVSTFAGGGGSSLGYSMAGYRELLAVEWDNNAVETFKLNFPDVPVYHGDIAELSGEECMKLAGLSDPGELDLLDGSPPCQGVSTAGKRNLNDPRNQLFREFVRLLRVLMPNVFVMENVPGLVKGKMKLLFAEIMKELKASGYQVRCKKLNAMYFYVPQSRERLIFIGVRDDLGSEASYPKAKSKPIAIKDAINNVNTSTLSPPFNDKYANLWPRIKVPSGRRLTSTAAQVIGKGFNNCIKPNPNMPSPCLPKTQTGRGFATIAHWGEQRALSIEEAKLIGSYPNDFKLIGKYSIQWERIGNSVPPLFMRSIALHVKRKILNAAQTPKRALPTP